MTGDAADVVVTGDGGRNLVGVTDTVLTLVAMTLPGGGDHQEGGAIQACNTHLALHGMAIEDNAGGYGGGAISQGGGPAVLTIVGSTFTDNQAGDGGALASVSWASAYLVCIADTVLSDNVAVGTGGALDAGSRIECFEVHFEESEITRNSPRAVSVGSYATPQSVLTDRGEGDDDSDLSGPRGEVDSLGAAETFTCKADGTWLCGPGATPGGNGG